jgi:hypothetical protein
MPVSPIHIQRRYRELGRIRLGDKVKTSSGKMAPNKLEHFRLTSPTRSLLDRAADLWGGTVTQWDGPNEGDAWQLATTTDELQVLVPQQDIESSQYFEEWTAGGCAKRCDGVTNLITGRACSCDPDNRACKITTHLQVMLPQLPDVGVWRITTHGFNAAAEIPGTVALLDTLRRSGQMPAATLGIEHRTSKKDGKTQRYIVPVLRVPHTLMELGVSTATEAPMAALEPVRRAELPAPPALPESTPAQVVETKPATAEAKPVPTEGMASDIDEMVSSGATSWGAVIAKARKITRARNETQPKTEDEVRRISAEAMADLLTELHEEVA